MAAYRIFGASLEELLNVPRDIGRGLMQSDVDHIFKACQALWLHDGNPENPHAELTAGDCSNGFVDTLRVLQYTPLAELFADQLIRRIRQVYHGPVDWVVGSDHAAATFSYAVAVGLRARHDFTEKGPDKTQWWNRFQIAESEVILHVEELVTTLATMQAVRAGLRGAHQHPLTFVPLAATLVDRRSDFETTINGAPIVSVARYNIQKWNPAVCPLCRGGSERIRPKANWAKLTGRPA